MPNRNVFVTVGTTKFDNLIETITSDEILNTLSKLGYDSMTLQIGNGTYVPSESHVIDIQVYRFKPSIEEDIMGASLVVSHAGAGSCLEILRAQKPLISVINEDLMENHQFELAAAFAERHYLYYCTCAQLINTLKHCNLDNLRPYCKGDPRKFVEYMQQLVGLI